MGMADRKSLKGAYPPWGASTNSEIVCTNRQKLGTIYPASFSSEFTMGRTERESLKGAYRPKGASTNSKIVCTN